MSRRAAVAVTALVIIQLVGGPMVVAAASTFFAGGGSTFQTDSGLSVTLGDDQQIQSGNPFGSDQSVTLANVTVDSADGGSLRLDATPAGTTDDRITVSNLDSGAAQTTITHPNGSAITIGSSDSVTQLTFNDTIAVGDDERDFQLSTASQTTVIVDTGGQGATAVSAGGSTLDDGDVQPDGTVRFEIPSGTSDVYLQDSASSLFVFNESAPTNLVNDGTGIRVRLFQDGDDEIVERNITDGEVELPDISSDERFVATVQANETEYYYRRIPIRNLQEQQEIYLLPKAADAATVEFTLSDRTGRFQNPTIRVKKPIRKDYDGDGSNETRYQTVVGDSFGTSGALTLNLERQQRYRLVLRNSNGARRVLGAFTPEQDAQRVPLTVAQVDLAPEEGESGVAVDASFEEQSGSGGIVRALYEDPNNDTSEVVVDVIRTDTQTNQTIASNVRVTGPLGRVTQTFAVNETPQNATYLVEFEAIRNGERITASRQLGNIPAWRLGYLNDQVRSLTAWVALIALSGLVVIRAPRIAAVLAVVLATVFSTLGLISVGPVPLGIAGATAILFVVSRGVGQ